MHDHKSLDYDQPQKYIHNIMNGHKKIIQDLIYIIYTKFTTIRTS